MTDLDQKQSALPVYVMGADNNGIETYPVASTPNGDHRTADLLVSGGVQGAVSVSTTAVAAKVGGSNLSNRKTLTVMPTDGSVYWGFTNAVTTSSGTEIFKNQMATFSVSDAVTVWLIASSSRNVRITEGA
jgi:hypothetical protein